MPDRYSWQQFPVSDYLLPSPLLAGLQALHGRQAASLLSGGLDGSMSGCFVLDYFFCVAETLLVVFDQSCHAIDLRIHDLCHPAGDLESVRHSDTVSSSTDPSPETTPLSRSASRAPWMILNRHSNVSRGCARCSHHPPCPGGGQLFK